MQKQSFSWGLIILMLFLFFPVGIFMIVKKVTSEKFNVVKNGKSLKTLGIVLLCFAGIYLIMAITEDASVLSAFFLFAVLGGLSFYKGEQYIKKGTKYSRYVSIINANNDGSIDNIAAAYPTSYEQAVKDIQEMLDAGYFMNSYIDQNKRELVMPKSQNTIKVEINNVVGNNATAVDTQPRAVKCQNCGATNTIVTGRANECEYCGSPL